MLDLIVRGAERAAPVSETVVERLSVVTDADDGFVTRMLDRGQTEAA